jgi:hypothetical protein
MIPDEGLAAIKARLEATTGGADGAWVGDTNSGAVYNAFDHRVVVGDGHGGVCEHTDLEFIVWAKRDIAALLGEAQTLRQAIRRLTDEVAPIYTKWNDSYECPWCPGRISAELAPHGTGAVARITHKDGCPYSAAIQQLQAPTDVQASSAIQRHPAPSSRRGLVECDTRSVGNPCEREEDQDSQERSDGIDQQLRDVHRRRPW